MQQFIEKFGKQIQGVVSGFDRLVFRGSLRRLNYVQWNPELEALEARGMQEYLWQNKILFKDYQDYVKKVSESLKGVRDMKVDCLPKPNKLARILAYPYARA
jgi:hypothetical protein